ncbi:hypothetical protein VKT23_015558 [Stygiomarasmius scandens]|uniref:Uncharacterized protein n=1 Tax=Marasmiellus scandens TaxID=2682957 RepID=A0ABR1IXJ0_9AGAR
MSGYVIMHKQYKPIWSVLSIQESSWKNKGKPLCKWKFGETELFWDYYSSPIKVCYASKRGHGQAVVYAKFKPRRFTLLEGKDDPTLEVTPEGDAHFDDILMSMLILERDRLAAVRHRPLTSSKTRLQT